MSLIDTLKALAITVRNEKKKEANSALRIGNLFLSIINYIESLDKNNQGFFSDEINLPSTPENGWYAYVGSTGTIWSVENGEWEDTEIPIPEDYPEALKNIQVISNDEYLLAITDNEQRVLFGIYHDATYYFATDIIPEHIYESLKVITDYLDKIKEIASVSEYEDYIRLLLDNTGKILSYYSKDGTFYPQKLEVPENALTQIMEHVEDKISIEAIDFSYRKSFAVPFPTSLVDIYVEAPIEEITVKGQKVKGSIKFLGDGWMARLYCMIGWQGSTSILMTYPELDPKNWSIDLYADEAYTIESEIKFGTWVYRDGFHLKKNYNDAFGCRNVVNARLYEKIYRTRPFSKRYPFSVANDIADSNLDSKMWSGAMCHIDGFIIRLFINGQNRGLHTLNLSKHRSNYQMKKNNERQILFEFGHRARIIHPIDYPSFEFRNPSGIEEGGEIPAGITKDITEDFFTKVSDLAIRIKDGKYYAGGIDTNITVIDRRVDSIKIVNNKWVIQGIATGINYIPNGYTDESLKTYLNELMPSVFWVDFFVFQDFLKNGDSIVKNTLIAIYEDGKAYPCVYDMDALQGIAGWFGTINNTKGGTAQFKGQDGAACQPIFALYYTLFFEEIKQRYKELRTLKIIDVENVLTMHNDLMSTAGIDMFREDFRLFPETPNFRDNNVNSEYWSFSYVDYPTAQLWNGSASYNEGDRVTLPNIKFEFVAVKANKNVKPVKFLYTGFPEVGGYYSGLSHLQEFLENQITYLDNYFN